ncbi:MAG: Esterase/lipase superfamily enzyme [Verrucomicrobia bacterium]|nr:MAG: Esterase/lipase superfamily enzyme [Verrucomicrobiota bacterium]
MTNLLMKLNATTLLRILGGASALAFLASCSTATVQRQAAAAPESALESAPGNLMNELVVPLTKALPPPVAMAPEPGAAGAALRGAAAPVDPKTAEAPFLTQRVFYGTNRTVGNRSDPNSYYSGSGSDKLEVGYCDVSIPLEHQAGKIEAPDPLSWQYWFAGDFREDPKRHVVLLGVKPQEKEVFLRDLRAKMRDGNPLRRRCFVFVHGFNVPFRNAARRTAQMAHDLGFPGAPVFFSWPSQGGEAYYLVDSENNVRSRPELVNFLELIARDSGTQEIYLLAHSMGTRVASQAFPEAYDKLGPLARGKLKSVILAAPDIDADVFNQEIVPKMQKTGIPLTLYASRADKALQISRQFNGKPRIGQDPILAAKGLKGVEVIDASAVKSDFTEHNYFGSSPILLREFQAIFDGKRPEQRSWLQLQTAPSGGNYWILSSP